MTSTQREYLDAIRALRAELGRWPTMAELAKRVDRSRSAAWYACQRLKAVGRLASAVDGSFYIPEGE